MLNKIKPPRSLQFLIDLTLFNLVLFSIFRIAFFFYFNDNNDPLNTETLLKDFYLGLKFDLRLSLLMALPFILLAWIPALQLLKSNITRCIWIAYFSLSFFLVLSLYTLNIGHYAYLGQMADASVLRFLEDFDTSMGMVIDSYPVIWISLAFISLISAYTYVCNKLNLRASVKTKQIRGKLKNIFILILSGFLVLFLIYGKISYYPLRWSDAFFSTHKLSAAIASNPIIYFYTTIKNQQIDYDEEKTRQHYDLMVEFLGIKKSDKQQLNFVRIVKPKKTTTNPPNIVMVFMESFASFKSGISGNPLNPSPNFDALVNKSHYFKNFYVPKVGTARSVFTALTELSDIEEIKTSTRNPLIIDQHIIINDFKDYEKLYFLGGSTSWGNIRGLISHNIKGLKIYEEGSYTSPRIDVWGISDNSLFKEANQVFRDLNGKPFFAIIQTSGNHPPYTIPESDTDFKLANIPKKRLNRYGFNDLKQFNGFRYLDYSIGKFMKKAQKEKYFDNTVFMFFGDHGYNAYPGDHSPKAEIQLRLNGNHVPLIIYAPNLLLGNKVHNKVSSLVDVMPTLAGIANIPYTNTSMGRDLFDTEFDNSRYAFTIDSLDRGKLGLIGENFYFSMNKDGSNYALHALTGVSPRDNIIKEHPVIARKMALLCHGIYETTKYIRFHNKDK